MKFKNPKDRGLNKTNPQICYPCGDRKTELKRKGSFIYVCENSVCSMFTNASKLEPEWMVV